MPQFQITHTTDYLFRDAVDNAEIECCLTPQNFPFQQLDYHKLLFQPNANRRSGYTDEFNNAKVLGHFDKALQKVIVSSTAKVTTNERQPLEQDLIPSELYKQWCHLYSSEERNALALYVETLRSNLFKGLNSTEEKVAALTGYIFEHFTFDTSATDINTPLSDIISEQKGVCQDFTRLMIAILQISGIPARYVSGYAYWQGNGKDISRERASHAWVSAYVEGSGWVDYDPTNNRKVDENYITLAIGRDYVDIVPVTGLLNQTIQHRIKVEVTVEKLRS